MPKLSANTILQEPGTFQPTVLYAGDEVPDWATGLLGDHLLETETEAMRAAVNRTGAAQELAKLTRKKPAAPAAGE